MILPLSFFGYLHLYKSNQLNRILQFFCSLLVTCLFRLVTYLLPLALSLFRTNTMPFPFLYLSLLYSLSIDLNGILSRSFHDLISETSTWPGRPGTRACRASLERVSRRPNFFLL